MQRMVNHCSLGVGRLRLCLTIKVDGSCAMNNNNTRSCRVQTEQTRVTLSEAAFYRLQFKPPTRLNLDQQEWVQLITEKYIVWSSLVKIWEYSIRSMEYVQRENAIFRELIFWYSCAPILSNWSSSPVHFECTVKYVSGCTQYISSGLRQQARHGRSTSAILSMTGLILRNKRSEWPTIERKLNIHHRMHVQRIPVMKN